jgi:NAD(P)-dependent dehydrogenase (short-subunit alcohol dehydrogenase family)
LVSGGGTGIGLACAQALTDAGYAVTVLGRREAPLVTAVESGAAEALIVADARTPPALHGFSVLVNAAGLAESAPFLKTDIAMFQRAIEVNLLAAVALTHAVLPGMAAAGRGRIVHIASTAALKGFAYTTAYTASKHALLGFVRALAQEVATRGITVNAICPGFTETAIVQESVLRIMARTGRSEEEARAELVRGNPQGRMVQPEEVAAAVLFLCSAGAAAVNGVALPIAGGEI